MISLLIVQNTLESTEYSLAYEATNSSDNK